MRSRLLAAVIVLGLCLPQAEAHAPGLLRPEVPFVVEDASISRALYGDFAHGDEFFVVQLRFEEDFALPIEGFVPHRASLAEHRPAWALVGPGLPAPLPGERAALPRPLPPGAGAIVDLNEIAPRPVFYEFFTRRFFWSSGVVAVAVPRGAFEIWIWSPRRTSGKFGIGFGVEERIDFADALANWGDYAY